MRMAGKEKTFLWTLCESESVPVKAGQPQGSGKAWDTSSILAVASFDARLSVFGVQTHCRKGTRFKSRLLF